MRLCAVQNTNEAAKKETSNNPRKTKIIETSNACIQKVPEEIRQVITRIWPASGEQKQRQVVISRQHIWSSSKLKKKRKDTHLRQREVEVLAAVPVVPAAVAAEGAPSAVAVPPAVGGLDPGVVVVVVGAAAGRARHGVRHGGGGAGLGPRGERVHGRRGGRRAERVRRGRGRRVQPRRRPAPAVRRAAGPAPVHVRGCALGGAGVESGGFVSAWFGESERFSLRGRRDAARSGFEALL